MAANTTTVQLTLATTCMATMRVTPAITVTATTHTTTQRFSRSSFGSLSR
jgi:hypothetical protein